MFGVVRRLVAALMKIRQIMVYTHDSIGLGEDGPTHQPVEQMASLRTTPNMSRLMFGVVRRLAICSTGWCVGPSSPRPIESWV